MKLTTPIEREAREVQSFLDGIRPVILVDSAWSHRLSEFTQTPLHENRLLVFQHDVDVALILRECVEDGQIIDPYRLALRTGHPPASSYAHVYETHAPNDPLFIVDFCGMQYTAYPDTIYKDVTWLLNQQRIHQWLPTIPTLSVHVVLKQHAYPTQHVSIRATRDGWERTIRRAFRETASISNLLLRQ